MSRMLLTSLFLIPLASAHAVAQPTPPTATDRDKARELTERAIGQTRKGEHQSAIGLYQRAYELSHEAILLSNIGSAYRALNDRDKALQYFCQYLEVDPTGKVAGFAREQADALADELSLLEPCAKPAGNAVTKEPPRPDKPPQPTAGDEEPEEPEATEELAGDGDPGEPAVSLPTAPRRAEPKLPGALTASGVVLGLAGVAALGGAGYYGWVGKRASDVLNGNRDGWTAEELEQERIGNEANSRMKILGIAGGAALATGVVLVVVGRSLRPAERRLALVPAVSPTSQGVALVGSFD